MIRNSWAEWNGRGRIRVVVLNLGCTLNHLGNLKNTDAWASPSESVIIDLGCGLALGLFYKAFHMILMYIQCRQPLDWRLEGFVIIKPRNKGQTKLAALFK